MRSLSNYPGQNILLKARPTTLTLKSARSLSNPAPQKRLVRSPGPSATLGRTSGLPSSTRGRSRMVQRPCPDLREGCAAMRIPTATEGRGAAMPPPTRPQKHVRLVSVRRSRGIVRLAREVGGRSRRVSGQRGRSPPPPARTITASPNTYSASTARPNRYLSPCAGLRTTWKQNGAYVVPEKILFYTKKRKSR